MAKVLQLASVPSLADILASPDRILVLPKDAIPQLRGELARLDTLLLARMLGTTGQETSDPSDRLLDVEEAAAKLGVSRDALYRNKFPFVVRIGNRRRFSEKGIEKFIRNRAGM
jgi:predicted DNA-binding transcriptional regulator AlpA